MKLKIYLIVGARPNFMKSAPLIRELHKHDDKFVTKLIHTGQHYDKNLSQLFFDQLKMPKPDLYLGVGSGSHAEQTAKIMIGLEQIFSGDHPDLVVVFGDVNSTLATAIVAAKLNIKLSHVEAGLRSFDNTMPEEINRIVTDRLSDLLFVTEQSGLDNLVHEGVDKSKIFFTGNIMIDSLVANMDFARKSDILYKLGLKSREYVAVTMHRPANVDTPEMLKKLVHVLTEISGKIPVIFPCHPRTMKNLQAFGFADLTDGDRLKITEPLGYIDFLKIQSEARFVLTDSGGVQEETTFLKIPCLTLRENTERPVTVDIGSNTLIGLHPDKIIPAADKILSGQYKSGNIPELWDGRTAGRIVKILLEKL